MKKPGSDQVFDFINITILLILIVIMAYPIYFVLIASVSDPTYVNSGSFFCGPKASAFWDTGKYLKTTVSGSVISIR